VIVLPLAALRADRELALIVPVALGDRRVIDETAGGRRRDRRLRSICDRRTEPHRRVDREGLVDFVQRVAAS
jgi:hypothetical protein